MANPHKLHWNGNDLPDALRNLPPGDYVLESADDRSALGIAHDLTLDAASLDPDRAALHRELNASIAEADNGQTEDFAKVLVALRQRM